ALAAAGSPEAREQIKDAFASGLEVSQLAGAVAVLAGGLVAALLLRRAERSEASASGAATTTTSQVEKAGDRADSTGPQA
ncbi:MFS transporter, partial [Streptomyces sp. SID10692]|nr:MFS transporter [Streptomyces sp. SID10692]